MTTPEMDCNLTAIGLPHVTSAVFLIAKSFWYIVGVAVDVRCLCFPFGDKA
jgi:hypothetical protein